MNKEEIRRRLAGTCTPEGTPVLPAPAEAENLGDGHLREGCESAAAPVGGGAGAISVTGGGLLIPAAVLVALVASPQGPEIVLTQRTAEMKNHPSQISLPGGRIEASDRSPAAAALREASEEVGLPAERVEVLGCLPEYRTVSDYCVHPFVGWVEPPVALVPDRREVADVFLVPLQFVIDPLNHQRESMWRDGRERHYYVLPFPGRRIWGATAAILVSLADALR